MIEEMGISCHAYMRILDLFDASPAPYHRMRTGPATHTPLPTHPTPSMAVLPPPSHLNPSNPP